MRAWEGTRPAGAYVEAAKRYARAVLDGTQPACKAVRQACERFERDLKHSLLRTWPYTLDVDKAERPCAFIELLHHVKGRWAKSSALLHLEDWQCFIVVNVFGWVVKQGKPRAGLRRFLEVYAEIPRKNGKSPLMAAIGLYMWCMDGEAGAEVYSGATTEKQAWEVFGPARLMALAAPDLIDELGYKPVRAKKLVIEEDNSRFEPMIGTPGDGPAPSCSIVDEYHEHVTNDQVDAQRTGMVGREQPLMLQITTAGTNLAGPCYDRHQECLKVLDGSFENENLFCIIYGIDEGDDWTTEAALVKANPNWGVSVDAEIVKMKQRAALLNPSDQTAFKTKHLNVWCAAKTVWMPLDQWDLCADPQLSPEEFKGKDCIGIIDLASKDDLASYTRMFPVTLKGLLHLYVFSKYYIPQRRLDDAGPNQVAYRRWAAAGLLTVAGEEEIEIDRVEGDVRADMRVYRMYELLYDPWRATQLAQHLTRDGATCVEVRQTVQNLSTPMKEVLSAVKAQRLHHDGNKVTRWMMSNVTAKVDVKDNIYPNKEKPFMKIDGPVTIIMGMSRAMLLQENGFAQWLADVQRGVK